VGVKKLAVWAFGGLFFTLGTMQAQTCSHCAEWNLAQQPFKVYGNTFYVGPHGLSAILITSPLGHVLIDGALAESADQIEANIRALGFRVEDIKLILSSHVHYDHAGGIAALARRSGARVVASPWSAEVLKSGKVASDDPQFGDIVGIAKVSRVGTLADGETLRVGPLALTAHLTPGHTAGGTSWTWSSCEQDHCLQMVYADSISAVGPAGYRFSGHPEVLAQFAKSFAWLDTVPCDVLLTAHPDASGLWERVGYPVKAQPGACRKLAQDGREGLKERLEKEAKSR